jgi:hypothetical protein
VVVLMMNVDDEFLKTLLMKIAKKNKNKKFKMGYPYSENFIRIR